MNTNKKNIEFEIKEFLTEENNPIKKMIGIANKFGVIDSYNDVTNKTTFAKTVKEKSTVPVLWGHDADKVIGLAQLSNKEDGLYAEMQINTDLAQGKEAYLITKQLHEAGRPMQLSIGYRTRDYKYKEEKNSRIRHLLDVEVLEISLTPIAANSQSEVQQIKKAQNDTQKISITDNQKQRGTQLVQNIKKMTMKDLREYRNDILEDLKKANSEIETKMNKSEAITDEVMEQKTNLENELKLINAEMKQRFEQQEELLRDDSNFQSIGVINSIGLLNGGASNQVTREAKSFDQMKLTEKLESKQYENAWLKKIKGSELTDVEQKFFVAGVDASNESAGAVIPTTIWNEVLELATSTSDLIKNVTILNVKGNLSIPIEEMTEGTGWLKEGAVASGKSKIDKIVLKGHRWAMVIKISKTVQTMTIEAFKQFIVKKLATKFATDLETAIAVGEGKTENQPTGILNTTKVRSLKIEKITYDSILEILASLPQIYSSDAKLIMSRNTFFTKIKSIKDEQGFPIMHVTSSDTKIKYNVLGVEVIISDSYPDENKDGKPFISYGQIKNYYINFQQELAIESSNDRYFEESLVGIKGEAILDGKVVQPESIINVSIGKQGASSAKQ